MYYSLVHHASYDAFDLHVLGFPLAFNLRQDQTHNLIYRPIKIDQSSFLYFFVFITFI